jgi:O-antigen/teichoic acid export membrane protein
MKIEKLSKNKVHYFAKNDLKSHLKKQAIRSGGITVFSRMLNFLIQTVATIVLARILTPEEFGLIAMVTSLGGFLVIFKDLGFTNVTIQENNINHEKISTLYWINVSMAVAVVLIIIILSPIFAWFYSDPRIKHITIIWSTYIFFAALSAQHIALLKRRLLFFGISINEIIAVLISNILAIFLALNGWSYWALVVRLLAIQVCMTAGAWVLCRWCPGLPSLRSGVRSMLLFGRNITGTFIINYFARSLDKILIGWRYGATQLGYYHKAYYLFVLPTAQLTTALQSVAIATLSKIRNQPLIYHNYYLKAISVMSFIGMPISFFFMVESEDLILLFLGPQWKESVELFRILAAGTGIWIIYSTINWIHVSLGRSDRLVRWGIFAFFVTSTAIFLGLQFGPKGVAVAYTSTLYLLTGLGLKYACKPIELKFRTILFALWRYFITALLAGLLCWYVIQLFDPSWARFTRLMISFLLYITLYLILVIAFFKNLQPINNFISVITEMFRNRS